MPHWRTMQEKTYIGSWDLVDRDGRTPKDWVLRIKSVESAPVKSAEVPKGKREVVIRFSNAKKPFICNTTNAKTIEAMYGPDTEGWVGKDIALYQTDVEKGRETIRGIRVRPRRPSSGPSEQIPERNPDPAIRDAQNRAFEGPDGEDPENFAR